ncbi:transposase family protein [Streptomyces sp. NPDC006925]|uniref:transposase family protein n=1 Tax=Streptomyces sp. NPDC006925 TaxID=3364768 RepID=UPI0036C37F1C
MVRWFREVGRVSCLARDAGASQATGYRYLHEGIDASAQDSPDLHEVRRQCHEDAMPYVILDGTLISGDRVAERTEKGNDVWFSGKKRHFADNVQFLAAPNGDPLWVSDVEPGSIHDLRAAGPLPRRPAMDCPRSPTSDTPAQGSASTPRCGRTPAFPRRCVWTTAPTTASGAASEPSANAPQLPSNNAVPPSSTSPCVRAARRHHQGLTHAHDRMGTSR